MANRGDDDRQKDSAPPRDARDLGEDDRELVSRYGPGAQLMRGLGWTGGGLGAHEDGIVEPVEAQGNAGRRGLGAPPPPPVLAGGSAYFCEVCQVECPGYVSFQQHNVGQKHLRMVRNRAGPGVYACAVCDIVCPDGNSLQQHEMGKAHLRKVALMQYGGDRRDAPAWGRDNSFPSALFCELCHVSTTDAAGMETHRAGQDHRRRAARVGVHAPAPYLPPAAPCAQPHWPMAPSPMRRPNDDFDLDYQPPPPRDSNPRHDSSHFDALMLPAAGPGRGRGVEEHSINVSVGLRHVRADTPPGHRDHRSAPFDGFDDSFSPRGIPSAAGRAVAHDESYIELPPPTPTPTPQFFEDRMSGRDLPRDRDRERDHVRERATGYERSRHDSRDHDHDRSSHARDDHPRHGSGRDDHHDRHHRDHYVSERDRHRAYDEMHRDERHHDRDGRASVGRFRDDDRSYGHREDRNESERRDRYHDDERRVRDCAARRDDRHDDRRDDRLGHNSRTHDDHDRCGGVGAPAAPAAPAVSATAPVHVVHNATSSAKRDYDQAFHGPNGISNAHDPASDTLLKPAGVALVGPAGEPDDGTGYAPHSQADGLGGSPAAGEGEEKDSARKRSAQDGVGGGELHAPAPAPGRTVAEAPALAVHARAPAPAPAPAPIRSAAAEQLYGNFTAPHTFDPGNPRPPSPIREAAAAAAPARQMQAQSTSLSFAASNLRFDVHAPSSSSQRMAGPDRSFGAANTHGLLHGRPSDSSGSTQAVPTTGLAARTSAPAPVPAPIPFPAGAGVGGGGGGGGGYWAAGLAAAVPQGPYFCIICRVPCSGPESYAAHMVGQPHARMVARQHGLIGNLRCDVCNIAVTCHVTLQSHLAGSAHAKRLRMHQWR